MALVNIDSETEQIEYKKSIGELKDDVFYCRYFEQASEGRIDFEDTDVKSVLDKLELIEGNNLLNAGAALFCDCGIVNELQIVKSIREAITNSFGHRMFDSGQSNEITIFKNRIEIYNPGAFPANKTPVLRTPAIKQDVRWSLRHQTMVLLLYFIGMVLKN